MPESVEQCVRSVIDEESVSESSAYAICWSRYNAGELKEDEDFEFGPVSEEDDDEESEDDWSETEKSRHQLRHIAGGLHDSYDGLDKQSSWSIGFATLAAQKAGMEDPLGVKSVAYKTVTGNWPSIHPAETTKDGRDHLWETYKYVVEKILGGGEVAKTLSKSNTMEKVNFTADFAGTQTVFKADDDFVIWGPASVEIVDKEGDRIHADALKEALPQLLKRGRLSLEHSDQLVGEIIESYELENSVELEIDGETSTRKEFPTDVIELDGKNPALYVAGRIYDDTRQAKRVRESIEDGELNSYSISGEALVSRSKIENGEPVNDIVEIDLSAVTVCEEGMNQGAKFATVAKDDSEEAEPNVLTIKSESGQVAVAKSDDAENVDTSAEHPGDRTLTIQRSEQNMSEETEKSEDNSQEITLSELKTEFQSVVKDALTEEDFAKEDDILGKEEVENIVEELVQEKMDEFETASEEDVEKEDSESEDDVEKADPLTEDEVRSIAQEVSKDAAVEAAEEVLERQAEEEEEEEDEEKANESEDSYEEEEEDEKQSGMSEDDLAAALADMAGVDADDAQDAIDALQSKENGEEEDEEDEDEEDEDDEEKANESEDSYEEEEEDEKANEEEEEEEEDAEADKGGSQYTVQELKEKLPEDVFDAVRGYVGEEKSETEKADGTHPDFDFDLDDAVEKAIDSKLGTAGTPTRPSGSTEKSYDDEDGEQVGNPALAIWSDK
jgi:hypothetical protein